MRSLVRRCTATALLVWCLPSCGSYQRTYPVAPSTIRGKERVMLKMADSIGVRTVRLEHPEASHDSVWGTHCSPNVTAHGPAWQCQPGNRWSAPMSAVIEIRTLKRDGYATSLVALVAIGATTALVIVLGETARD